ncbi:hypothetical protein [Curvibacter gracilis]|uniref:hypothetical protein n=1 Tax=Curvibacter gracilis TaxID=230310 RepID=UPI0012F82164|nr:hypothetical protein [Curvibacter gracilis]
MTIGQYLQQILSDPKHDGVITYGDLAHRFDLPIPDQNYQGHPFANLFHLLDQEDADFNRPFRTSAVVSKNQGRPGPGFFTALKNMKNISSTAATRDEVWLKEWNAARQFEWPKG